MAQLSLEAYFLHQEQVMGLIGAAETERAVQRAARVPLPVGVSFALTTALARFISSIGLPDLQRVVLDGSAHEGQLVGVQQAFYFRRAEERYSPGNRPIDFKGDLNTDATIVVSGSLNSERCPVASGASNLSRRRAVYMIGTITELGPGKIVIRPMFAGTRTFIDRSDQDPDLVPLSRRIYPSEVTQFALARFDKLPDGAMLKKISAKPESEVKSAFAAILGEPFTQRDWGGETSDLYTSQVQIDGHQTSSAWLLKGPGHRGPMTIAALGKRGDQIDRLFGEPAELLVLQHHREIRSAVINMMEVYANDLRKPRRYMVLDGADTARILTAYGHL